MKRVALALALAATALPAAESPAVLSSDSLPKQITIPGVQNAFRVTGTVYSGSQPEGDASFAALAQLGVKTIISVDGAKPDVETARRYGLRYIHLPFGYDGVPTNRIVELAKAAATTSAPLFVHCHHGLHRGPAAVAILCQATQGWNTNRALNWLHQAGTASDYAGLYRAIVTFQKPSLEQLARVKALPETAKTSSLVEAMVLIDEHFSRLKLCRKSGWKTPADHADITPEHEALMLWEQLRELDRLEDTAKRPADYRQHLVNAQHAAKSMRESLRQPDVSLIEKSFRNVNATCSACHRAYRN